MVLIKAFTGDCACDHQLSRASQAVQPENALLILSISPVVYFLEDASVSIGKAGRVVLSLVYIERCVYSGR